MSVQESLRDVQEAASAAEARYAALLGLQPAPARWHNTTLPVLVTYARGDAHAQAVGFLQDAARLPYSVLLYDLGLKPTSLQIVRHIIYNFEVTFDAHDLMNPVPGAAHTILLRYSL